MINSLKVSGIFSDKIIFRCLDLIFFDPKKHSFTAGAKTTPRIGTLTLLKQHLQ